MNRAIFYDTFQVEQTGKLCGTNNHKNIEIENLPKNS